MYLQLYGSGADPSQIGADPDSDPTLLSKIYNQYAQPPPPSLVRIYFSPCCIKFIYLKVLIVLKIT